MGILRTHVPFQISAIAGPEKRARELPPYQQTEIRKCVTERSSWVREYECEYDYLRLLCISREFLWPVNLCTQKQGTGDPNRLLFHFDTCPRLLRRR